MNKADTGYRRPRLKHVRRWRLRLGAKQSWPFLVWLGACFAAWCIWRENPHVSTAFVRGTIDSKPILVAPAETAVLKSVLVREGDRVERGQALAEMDTSLIDHGVTADLVDTVRIESSFGDTHQDVLQAISQRLDAIARAKGELAACLLEWEREKGELEALKVEHARRQGLHDQKLIDGVVANELRPQIEAIEKACGAYPALIDGYKLTLSDAEKYYADIIDWLDLREGETVSEAIRRKLQQDSMEKLLANARTEARAYRESYILRAERAAVVSAVLQPPGQVALAGVPVIRLVDPNPDTVRAFIPEEIVHGLSVGQKVEVRPEHGPSGAAVIGRVETVCSEVWMNAMFMTVAGRQVPVRTRQAIVRIEGKHDLVGGQSVAIRPVNGHALGFARLLQAFASALRGLKGG